MARRVFPMGALDFTGSRRPEPGPRDPMLKRLGPLDPTRILAGSCLPSAGQRSPPGRPTMHVDPVLGDIVAVGPKVAAVRAVSPDRGSVTWLGLADAGRCWDAFERHACASLGDRSVHTVVVAVREVLGGRRDWL